MKQVIKRLLIFLVVVTALTLCYVPLFKDMKFGLDLKGGFEVLYQVKRTDGKKLTSSDLNSTYDILTKNVDGLGVSEPDITIEGKDQIRVKLAGVTDIENARKALSKVANISFRDINDKLLMDSSVIKSARLGIDDNNNPAVSLQIKDKEKFLEVTNNISAREEGENLIVIWYNFEQGVNSYSKEGTSCGTDNSDCLSAATVSEGFSSDVIITGNFTKEEAESLATSINAGSISTKLTELSSSNVNASYGKGVLEKTLIAGIIGMILIILLMTILYKFAGFISGINLLLYMLLVIAIFWLIGGVLTLPGIAALVLGIGMAVDSCVITFERIKEELKEGKSLETAYKNGNSMSFSSIIDANITTFIVALVLFKFGISSIKGFATMLIITIFATMFIMVFINKKVLKWLSTTKYFESKPNAFIKFITKKDKKLNINIIKHTKKCFITTIIFIVFGLIYLFVSGLNLGIDFSTGSDITINSKNKLKLSEIKNDFKVLKYDISEINKQASNEVNIKINNELKDEEIAKVNNYFEEKYEATTQINVITNLVKQELVKNAIYAVIIAIIAIIIYISIRFKFSYAISSVIALLHDIAVIVILFSIFKIEVNVIFIAAILTILGYSINNTIVVFDRVRENMKNKKDKLTKEILKNVVNKSISETLTRSIYTTITTLIPVICLIILGSKGILPFNIAIIIGLFAGCYSSSILAGQLWYIIESKKLKK